MNIKMNLAEEFNIPNKATLRTLFIPIAMFAIFCLLIPFRLDSQTDSNILHFTKRIFAGVILFSFFLRSEEFFVDMEHKKNLDKFTTIITWIIFLSVVIVIGIPSIAALALLSLVYARSVYWIMIMLSSVSLFTFGAKPKFMNSFPKVGQCITIANHCSDIDDIFVPLIFWFRKWKVIFASEIIRIPLVRFFANIVGIPLNREDRKSRGGVALKTQRAINQGFDILIYPEGRRLQVKNESNLMEEFVDDGAFEISIKNNLPIVPVVLSWTYLFKPRSGQWWNSPRTIRIIYLDPVYPPKMSKEEINDKDTLKIAVEKLKSQIRPAMISKLRETLQS